MSINEEQAVEAVIDEEKTEYERVGVRFKEHGKTYYFEPCGITASAGEAVIVETARGLEYGTVSMGNKIVDRKSVV